MATAVLVPMSTINLNGGVLPPSAISNNSPRHGRSRTGSLAKGKSGARTRGYSLADERDAIVSKALALVLRRARNIKEESSEKDSDDGKLEADADGWVDLDDLLEHPKISALGITFAEVQRITASTTTPSRLSLRLSSPTADASDAASYELRLTPPPAQAHKRAASGVGALTAVTPQTTDLPEFVIFETTYPKYHLILTSGGIKRAGGQPFLTFAAATEEASDTEVCIWVDLQASLAGKVAWKRTEAGVFITQDEIPKSLWTRAVARRGDLGVLFEGGEVRKEVPVGFRGKGAKAKKGKGVLKSRSEEAASDSASE